jgi:NAD(P)H-hydrate epimerase
MITVMDSGQQKSFSTQAGVSEANLQECQSWLPVRDVDANKGSNGRVLIVGGEQSMAGAVCLAGWSAYTSGAGLVHVATRPEHASTITAFRPELLVHGIDERAQLGALLATADVIACGPGLGQTRWSREVFEYVLEHGAPRVIDADGLNLLAEDGARSAHWVLTPHPGEAGRLLNCSVADIQADRLSAAREIAATYGGVCVLKGRGSLVVSEQGEAAICPYGNEGLAVAGTGDILTGFLAGLLAQGMDGFRAAVTAVVLHACAADRYAVDAGNIGMLASDIISPLRALRNSL